MIAPPATPAANINTSQNSSDEPKRRGFTAPARQPQIAQGGSGFGRGSSGVPSGVLHTGQWKTAFTCMDFELFRSPPTHRPGQKHAEARHTEGQEISATSIRAGRHRADVGRDHAHPTGEPSTVTNGHYQPGLWKHLRHPDCADWAEGNPSKDVEQHQARESARATSDQEQQKARDHESTFGR